MNYEHKTTPQKKSWKIPYESPILGKLLDLISLGKINLFEPRFESYDPYGTWQNSQASMVTVEIRIKTFIVKNPNMGCFLCVPYSGTLVHKQIREVP